MKSADLNEITAASVQLKSPDPILYLAYRRVDTPPWSEFEKLKISKGLNCLNSKPARERKRVRFDQFKLR